MELSMELVTIVHHVWEIWKEKDTPRVFSVMEVDILLDYIQYVLDLKVKMC